MKPRVSIIMGSTSDMPVMQEAPFEKTDQKEECESENRRDKDQREKILGLQLGTGVHD